MSNVWKNKALQWVKTSHVTCNNLQKDAECSPKFPCNPAIQIRESSVINFHSLCTGAHDRLEQHDHNPQQDWDVQEAHGGQTDEGVPDSDAEEEVRRVIESLKKPSFGLYLLKAFDLRPSSCLYTITYTLDKLLKGYFDVNMW